MTGRIMKTKRLFASLTFVSLTFSLTASAFASQKDVAAALDNGQLTLAQRAYSELSTDEQSTLSGKILHSRILMAKDDTEDAYDLLEELREQHPNNADIEYNFGRSAAIMAQKASIFSKLGYASEMLEAMENTIKLNPDHLDALSYLVGFHLAAPGIAGGDTDEALIYALKIKELSPEVGFSQLANVYWQTDEAELAQKTITAGIAAFPENASMYVTRASAYIKAEKWRKARTDLQQAIKYAENDEQKSRALYQQGKVSAESGQEIDQGIAALIQAMPLANDQYQPWVKYRLAQLYIHNKELKKAKSYLAKIDTDKDDDLKKKVKKLKKKLKKMKV